MFQLLPKAMLTLTFLCLTLSSLHQTAHACSKLERQSLLSFSDHISASPPLNWSESTDCCQWEGVACTRRHRVTHLWLPEKHLSGTIFAPSLASLRFLYHLNLSHNGLSGALPLPLSPSLRTLDISSNNLNGSIEIEKALIHLVIFNSSNNSFTGVIPSSICKSSPYVEVLDFSMNKLNGSIPRALGECRHLRVLRAGSNALSGEIPNDLYNAQMLKEISLPNNQLTGCISSNISLLSDLHILELHMNELSGELPPHIGFLSNLQKLQIYDNGLNGTLPPSLMECSNLTILILRNNRFGGEISNLNFSKIQRLEAIDLGNNSFVGRLPDSLCFCNNLVAVRLAYNELVGEIPQCMASLTSLVHLSLASNNLSNVSRALEILSHCENLTVLFLWGSFHNETNLDEINGYVFPNLQYLTLGGCKLKGPIPFWISRLTKLKLLDVSRNEFSGPVPSWFGRMPSLFSLNLTQNLLSGELPNQLGQMRAMIEDDSEGADSVFLPLPYVAYGLQYNRILNMRHVLALGSNGFGGRIPEAIGSLRLLQVLDLSDNGFDGGIPQQLHCLSNLESLNMSVNRLSGEIPESLTQLHFLSAFSVADNDLQGEVPSGGQFETFSADSFEGNPKLCGAVLGRMCWNNMAPAEEDDDEHHLSWYLHLPFGLGYFVGFAAVVAAFLLRNER